MMITDGGRKAKKERESVFTAGIRYAGNVEKKSLSIRTIWETSRKGWTNIWAALGWWVLENFPVWIRFWKKKFPLLFHHDMEKYYDRTIRMKGPLNQAYFHNPSESVGQNPLLGQAGLRFPVLLFHPDEAG